MKLYTRLDRGREIAKALWPDLELGVEGDFWDKYGQDARMADGRTIQIKFDHRIALSGNLWHEVYEKSALNDAQPWRKSPGVADAYIFCTETLYRIVGYFVPVDTLAKAEMGMNLKCIRPNNGLPTSMGFLIPIASLPVGSYEARYRANNE